MSVHPPTVPVTAPAWPITTDNTIQNDAFGPLALGSTMSYANINAEAGPSRAAKRPRLVRDASSPRADGTPPRTRARLAVTASHNDVFDASTVLPQTRPDYQQRVAEWVQQRHQHVEPRLHSPKPSPAKSATAVSALQADQAYAHLRTPSRGARARENGTSDRGEADGDPSVLFSDRTPRSQSGTPKSRGDEMIDTLLAAYGPKPDLVRPPGYGLVQEEWEDEATEIPGEGELGAHDLFMPVEPGVQDVVADDMDVDAEGEADEDDSFLPVDPFWQGEPAAPTEPLPHQSTTDLDTPLPIATEVEPTATATVVDSSQLRIDGQQLQARASDYLPRPYAPALATQPSREPLTGGDESETLVFHSTGAPMATVRDRTRSPTPPPILPMTLIERISAQAEARTAEPSGEPLDQSLHGYDNIGQMDSEPEDDDDDHFEEDMAEKIRVDQAIEDPKRNGFRERDLGLSSEPEDDDEEVVPGPSRPKQGSASRRRSLSKPRREALEVEDEEEDDTPLAESYHSGDSDQYEMEYRPVLERTEVKRDIREFVSSLKTLHKEQQYKVVDRLGEGTFSSVYLAKDVYHNRYSNRYWSGKASIRRPDLIQKKRYDKPVALKKVLATSSPTRIENELSILEALRGCRNVSALITAFREDDQVIIVLPYHQSDDFRFFYRLMDAEHMRSYMRNLMEGLADIHSRGIIHRDVKPANFLYDYARQTGVLVDFGLAERYAPPRKVYCQHQPAGLEHLHGKRVKTTDTATVEQAVYEARKKSRGPPEKVGIPKDDKRPAMRANRAGTRGFRAPEVLFKCPDQTFAIDIWSTGIMLLSILTHKFPIFNSNDDVEALMEIAGIYGRAHMEKCAMLHNRTLTSNVPQLDSPPDSLASVILKLNPHIYTPPYAYSTPTQAKNHIEAMDDAMDLCTQLLRLDCTRRFTARQALNHCFLQTEGSEPDREDRVHPMIGKCGALHMVEGDPADGMGEGHAKHQATFGDQVLDMPFGTGIPATHQDLCPEHLHYQQRRLANPVAACRPLWIPDNAPSETEESDDESEDEGFGSDTLGDEDLSHHADDSDSDLEGEETLVEHDQELQAKYIGTPAQVDTDHYTADAPSANGGVKGKLNGKAPGKIHDEGADRALKDVSVNTPRRDRVALRMRALA